MKLNRPRTRRGPFFLVGLILGLAALVVGSITGAQAAAVGLGTADSFAVLAGAGVTNTGPTIINGDLGACPTPAITGFPPGVINGTVHAGNAVCLQAQSDLTIAYNDAAGRAPTTIYPGVKDLGGLTLTPGVYKADSFAITGPLTLDAQGDPDAVFIFQAGSTLITAPNSSVSLINGAQACNVFWQVGSSATLGVGSTFVGTILALTSITANTNATVQGRLLARNGAVTLDSNTVTRPVCLPPTTTTSSTSTTLPATTTTSTSTTSTSTTVPATTTTSAITIPPITLPPGTLPPITVPPITVPPITVPPITVPPITVPPITVPPVETTTSTLPATTTTLGGTGGGGTGGGSATTTTLVGGGTTVTSTTVPATTSAGSATTSTSTTLGATTGTSTAATVASTTSTTAGGGGGTTASAVGGGGTTSASEATGTLARTGSSVRWWLLVGGLAIALGGLMVQLTRPESSMTRREPDAL